MPLNVIISSTDDPVRTTEKLNEWIDRGWRFTAVVDGERVPIRAAGAYGPGDELNVVVGQIHENRWAVTTSSSIELEGNRQRMRV